LIKNAMIIYEKSGERESLKFISENFKKMYWHILINLIKSWSWSFTL
jgi:hypothetical protein